ncbi:hypothetical protein AcV7_004116 [Taiwanofungus camphoratus]|nr:hypothetical protein AcV7_004116 [Antrodia cinnamomea]
MSRATHSSSSSTSAASLKHKRRSVHSRARLPASWSSSYIYVSPRRKFSRDQLLKSLEILGPLTVPLPPELPPSPPASRGTSPVPPSGSKRKLDADSEQGHNKKPRTSTSTSDDPGPSRLPASQAAFNLRSEPSEDGEVSEDTLATRNSLAIISNVPVRRPRRGTRLPYTHYDELYEKYHALGKVFKSSGQQRIWSTYPHTDPSYRLLFQPPRQGTLYHKYGHLFTRLELLEGLVCFAYALWCKDYSRKQCVAQNWSTFDEYMVYCKREWRLPDTADDREKAFVGLIYMLEAFMCARKVRYGARAIDAENERIMKRLKIQADAEAARDAAAAALREAQAAKAQATPPMLPSPASIISSANSTPTSTHSGTPNAASSSTSDTSAASDARPPQAHRPPNKEEKLPPAHITVAVNAQFVSPRKAQSGDVLLAAACMETAQRLLTLPVMVKHFPRTFARMMYSSLSPGDEHEPDIEDEEGELFWPGQCVTGEGLGWVCHMGKSMIKEFGKGFGYKGLDGTIMMCAPAEGLALVGEPGEVRTDDAVPIPESKSAPEAGGVQR